MNPEDRKVMEMALDALKKTMGAWGGTCAWHADVKEALALIDERLQADEKKPAEDVLWVYEWDTYLGVHRWLTSAPYNEREPDRRVAYVPQADEREEPVAWMQSDHLTLLKQHSSSSFLARCSDHQLHPDYVPLYAHGRKGDGL